MWKDLEDALADWMESQTEKFWRGGFEQLPERWTEIVRSQGKYFDERQNAWIDHILIFVDKPFLCRNLFVTLIIVFEYGYS